MVNKRTMNPGFAGIQNELFGFDNTIMVFGDAKAMLTDLLKDLKDLKSIKKAPVRGAFYYPSMIYNRLDLQ